MIDRVWVSLLLVSTFLAWIPEVAAILGVAIAVNSLQGVFQNIDANSQP